MNQDNFVAKPRERSHSLVIGVAFVIAVLMPLIRATAIGETEVAAAYTTTVSASAGQSPLPGYGADTLSLLVVGVFLLGLGAVLRRSA